MEDKEKEAELKKIGIMKRVSDMAQQKLKKEFSIIDEIGFDKFKIDPYYSETSQSTSARLVVGKDIREDVSVTYTTDIAGIDEQTAEIEYSLSNHFSLTGDWNNQSEDAKGSFGGDLKFRFEFR
ncbi:translocation/assembly module TamB domain-containing protein [Thermodesulfobacteriota bacterium]